MYNDKREFYKTVANNLGYKFLSVEQQESAYKGRKSAVMQKENNGALFHPMTDDLVFNIAYSITLLEFV